jgi:hypothetical protein
MYEQAVFKLTTVLYWNRLALKKQPLVKQTAACSPTCSRPQKRPKRKSLKINFAKPIGCSYICNRLASYLIKPFMRRDIFQAIADPTRRAILVLVAVQAMTPNAIATHFNITRQSI